MGQVKFSVNGQPTTAAIALREIKRKFDLTSDELGHECFLSGQTIDNIIAEKENISTRTYSMVISYVRKKLTPKQTIMDTNQKRTRVVRRATPEQIEALKEKIRYLKGTHLSAKELADALGVSAGTVNRVLNNAKDFSENCYHLMMRKFMAYMKGSSLPLIATETEEKTVLKELPLMVNPQAAPIDNIRAALKYLSTVIPTDKLLLKLGISQTGFYKIMTGVTKQPRAETLRKIMSSPLVLNYLQGLPVTAISTPAIEVKTFNTPQETFKVTMEKVEDFTGVNPRLLIQSVRTKLESQLNDLKGLEAMINNTPEDMKTEIYPKVLSRIYAIVPKEKV